MGLLFCLAQLFSISRASVPYAVLLFVNIIPKYLYSSVYSNIDFPILNFMFSFDRDLPKTKTFLLFTLISNFHCSQYDWKEFKLFWNSSLLSLNKTGSSAYSKIKIRKKMLKLPSYSSIYGWWIIFEIIQNLMNRNSDKFSPCLTPYTHSTHWEPFQK